MLKSPPRYTSYFLAGVRLSSRSTMWLLKFGIFPDGGLYMEQIKIGRRFLMSSLLQGLSHLYFPSLGGSKGRGPMLALCPFFL